MKLHRALPATIPGRQAAVAPRLARVRSGCVVPVIVQHARHYLPQRISSRPRLVIVRAEPTAAPPEEEDFDLLSTKVAELTAEMDGELKGVSIYLVGMMGCGKSTLGKMLANTLKYNFFDTDTIVELAHDKKPVAEIFKDFGEPYFRDAEAQTLKQLAPYKNLVVATGGGAVLRPMNWSYMQQGVVVWLKGTPELHAKRVSKDGLEKRPLLADAGTSGEDLYQAALKKVTGMLEERTKYYENADLVIPLDGHGADAENGAPTAVVMYRLLTALKAKIEATKAEREAKRNFRIENAEQLKTMRTMPSPAPEQ